MPTTLHAPPQRCMGTHNTVMPAHRYTVDAHNVVVVAQLNA